MLKNDTIAKNLVFPYFFYIKLYENGMRGGSVITKMLDGQYCRYFGFHERLGQHCLRNAR